MEVQDNIINNAALLVIAGGALTFLIKYLITTKDKNTEEISKDIKAIMTSLNSNANKTELLHNDFKHIGNSLSNLRHDVQELNKIAIEHTRKIEGQASYRGQSERQFADLDKKLNYLKHNNGKP